MTLYFTKMQTLGNDFIVIDAIHQSVKFKKEDIIALAQRNTGIGFDQCLLIETSKNPDIDFFYRIFNANGTEVNQCGNGARCLLRFAISKKLTTKTAIRVATKNSLMHIRMNRDNSVTVDFGIPNFKPKHIPITSNVQAPLYYLPLEDGNLHAVHAVSVGNPHAITVMDDISHAPVAHLGKEISEHYFFPEQTNASFMQIINKSNISLRVYERGCGETTACGSAAVAAVAIGRLYHQLAPKINVHLPGGELKVTWDKLDGPISLTGSANFVYEGVIDI